MCYCKIYKKVLKLQQSGQNIPQKKTYVIKGNLQYYDQEKLVGYGSITVEMSDPRAMHLTQRTPKPVHQSPQKMSEIDSPSVSKGHTSMSSPVVDSLDSPELRDKDQVDQDCNCPPALTLRPVQSVIPEEDQEDEEAEKSMGVATRRVVSHSDQIFSLSSDTQPPNQRSDSKELTPESKQEHVITEKPE